MPSNSIVPQSDGTLPGLERGFGAPPLSAPSPHPRAWILFRVWEVERGRGGERILINLCWGIFSSLDRIFSFMHTLPSKEESIGVAAGPPLRSLGISPVSVSGCSGPVALSLQILPQPHRLHRDQSQRCTLPGWHHDFVFALPCLVWLMPRWDSMHWGQLVELEGGPRSPLWGPAASASQ